MGRVVLLGPRWDNQMKGALQPMTWQGKQQAAKEPALKTMSRSCAVRMAHSSSPDETGKGTSLKESRVSHAGNPSDIITRKSSVHHAAFTWPPSTINVDSKSLHSPVAAWVQTLQFKLAT